MEWDAMASFGHGQWEMKGEEMSTLSPSRPSIKLRSGFS